VFDDWYFDHHLIRIVELMLKNFEMMLKEIAVVKLIVHQVDCLDEK
jgi:hypothetical protein